MFSRVFSEKGFANVGYFSTILAKTFFVMKIIRLATFLFFFSAGIIHCAAQSPQEKSVTVNKNESGVRGSNGGKATANQSGTEIKNSRGGGVEAKKGEVSAKSSSGTGAVVNNKGVQVKGKNGGMIIDKKKLEIKSKNVNIKLGK